MSADTTLLGNGANGENVPETESAAVCPPTSGHLMAEKMRLGRQDQEETDTGDLLHHVLNTKCVDNHTIHKIEKQKMLDSEVNGNLFVLYWALYS